MDDDLKNILVYYQGVELPHARLHYWNPETGRGLVSLPPGGELILMGGGHTYEGKVIDNPDEVISQMITDLKSAGF